MPTNRSPYYFHHWLVQHYFGCAKDKYKTTKSRDVPGLRIELAGTVYRVESRAERLAICRQQLASVLGTYAMPDIIAQLLLDGAEKRPGFREHFYAVLDELLEPVSSQRGKDAFSQLLVFQQAVGLPLWGGVVRMSRELLGVALLVLARLEGPDVLAGRLADLYFTYGHSLAAHDEALVLRTPPETDVDVLLYEVGRAAKKKAAGVKNEAVNPVK